MLVGIAHAFNQKRKRFTQTFAISVQISREINQFARELPIRSRLTK